MRTFPVRLAMAAAAAVLAGCDRSPTGSRIAGVLEITPDQPSYAAGSVVFFAIRNTSPLEVWYATCGSFQLQRRWLRGWVDTRPEQGPVLCMQFFNVVQPGHTNVEQVPLYRDQAPGTYRVLISGAAGSLYAPGIYEASTPFEVRRR